MNMSSSPMEKSVIWLNAGKFPRIRWDGSGVQLRILSVRRAGAGFGSYLGSGLRQNNGGFLVRDDLPQLTTAVPTAAAPLPGWTSP